MRNPFFYIVNALTIYRLAAVPVLLVLLLQEEVFFFKWLLGFSFFTDVLDGYLARRFKATSEWGARLDSIADDLTVAVGILGFFLFRPAMVYEHRALLILLFVLFLVQNLLALVRYGRPSSFHTYMAKLATLLQGSFLILIFFTPDPLLPLFYAACIATALDLIEESVLVLLLPHWQTNVKGLYWVWRKRVGSL